MVKEVKLTTTRFHYLWLCCLALPCSMLHAQAVDEPEGTFESTIESTEVMPGETPPEDEYLLQEYTPPPVNPVAMRQAPEDAWNKATQNLDYSDDQPPPPAQQKPKQNFDPVDWNADTAFIGKLFQGLAVLIALAAIAYWAFRIMQAPKNKKIASDGVLITTENIEAYIHETDLERFLREALTAGNFPLAIRLYYLQIIKTLSEKGAIQWSKEKTNRDYLREMRDHRSGQAFRAVTRTYERVWYGNQPLDMTGFALIEPDFKQLLTQL